MASLRSAAAPLAAPHAIELVESERASGAGEGRLS